MNIENTENNVATDIVVEKEKTVGKFHPKRKFLNFIQGRKGGVRFHTDTAFIKSEELTGVIEGAIFKITICDEGINFEEVDTNLTDDNMIQRFIDDIDSHDVTGYMQKYVTYGFDFRDKDNNKLYLEVDYKKPIDQLFSLLDNLKEEKDTMEENTKEINISNNALSILDSLFDEPSTETKESEIVPDKVESSEEVKETYAQQMMRESFEKMNQEKIDELSDRIEKKEKDISKYKIDIRQNEANLKTASEDIQVLYSRLDSLKPSEDPNGFVFYVSPENKSGISADQNVIDVVEKIAPLLKLKKDVVIDFLTKGFYTIKIAKNDDIESENVEITKEIAKKIQSIDILGKISMVGSNVFEYRGELSWHKLVDKMIRLGFEQSPEYDKFCGSPSYDSEFKDETPIEIADNQEVVDIETKKESTNFIGQTVREITEPTTLVVIGEGDWQSNEIQITDDETSFELYVGDKEYDTFGSMGFITIVTLEEYKEFYEKNKDNYVDMGGLIEGFVLPNFTGKIEVSAKLYGGGFSNKFDISDYIEHQVDDSSVILRVAEGTVISKLNDDLSLPIDILRDIKIEKIIE